MKGGWLAANFGQAIRRGLFLGERLNEGVLEGKEVVGWRDGGKGRFWFPVGGNFDGDCILRVR